MLLAVLQSYSEEKLLPDYTSFLKKYIEAYEDTKFFTFLENFSTFHQTEQKGFFFSPYPFTYPLGLLGLQSIIPLSKANTKSTLDSCDDLLDESPKLPKFKTFPDLEKEYQMQSSVNLKGIIFVKKLIKFLEIEAARKDNFFYEFVYAFGERFAAKYEDSLQYFKKEIKNLNKSKISIVYEA